MAELISVKSHDKEYQDLDPNGNFGIFNEAYSNDIMTSGDPNNKGSSNTAVIDIFNINAEKSEGNPALSPRFLSRIKQSDLAVKVRQACKNYSSNGKLNPILQDLNMNVKRGTIYSLLGSSGCGKTTLLTCVVGVKHLDSGEILINGHIVGSLESSVPGWIGYMPQDIALYNDFSIKETLNYFGSLNGMKSSEIQKRGKFLIDLLKVPEETRRISTLSGGQKRRVSVAVTLIHSPPLIILDEPTVGVDPLLRESIWKHLRELVYGGNCTVIITTHYIDEAGDSDVIGVMRGGRLIAESKPAELYEEFNSISLQDVVLKLCYQDENIPVTLKPRSKSIGVLEIVRRLSNASVLSNGTSHSVKDDFKSVDSWKSSFMRIKSLTRKNLVVLTRNILLLVFAILTPASQTLLLGLAVGNDPRPIPIGVINHELNFSACDPIAVAELPPCILVNLSCKYLDYFPKDTIKLINFNSEEKALSEIKIGALHGYMKIPDGYSDYVFERSSRGIDVGNETLEGSTITFKMDASNAVITQVARRIIYESYQSFIRALLSECNYNPQLGGLPLKFEHPVYGNYDVEFREYISVGVIIAFAFFFPVCTSSVSYIWDKKQGTMERSRIAGVKAWELIFSYFFTEGLIVIFQVVGLFLIMNLIFNIPNFGSTTLEFLLVVVNGFAGISLGLLFGAICTEEIQAILLALAVITPTIFLSGPIWPISGMPSVIQHIAYLLPGTLSTEAFRVIVTKGWTFSHFQVWIGFSSAIGWIIFYSVANLGVHKFSLAKK